MICAGTMSTRSRKVVKSIPISLFLIAVCSSFCFAVPLGLIIKPLQIFKFQASEAITMYAQLLVRSCSGADSAHCFSCAMLFS